MTLLRVYLSTISKLVAPLTIISVISVSIIRAISSKAAYMRLGSIVSAISLITVTTIYSSYKLSPKPYTSRNKHLKVIIIFSFSINIINIISNNKVIISGKYNKTNQKNSNKYLKLIKSRII